MQLEAFILDVMEDRRRGKSVLHFLSYLYQGGIALRNRFYDRGWIKSVDIGLPVVSVGNIVAGGTGKTPLVKLLAEIFQETGKVAILSRGYKSEAERRGETMLVSSEADVFQCGDEPFWLSSQLPRVQVWVGKNRIVSAFRAKQDGCDLIILDDGMQHRALKRDFEIVVVDGKDPFGKGFFLPRGFLRDSPDRLKNADLIVVIEPTPEIEKKIRMYTDAPMVFMQIKTPVKLQGKKVGVFCAIGRPERFLKTVQEAGGEVIASFFKPDHDRFHPEELFRFAEKSKADMLLCTEKDYVKIPVNFSCGIPLQRIPSQLKIMQGEETWEKFLTTIQKRIKK